MRESERYMRVLRRSVCQLTLLLVCVLTACNTTKFVPQGEYLLNDVKIKVQDTKDIQSADLMKYVQQRQNTEILGFWKLQLNIYNTASTDTAKWTSRNARRIGEPPVIFSSKLADASCNQLIKAMNNKGYFRAEVDTFVTSKGRKVDITYQVVANQPYMIGTYSANFEFDDLNEIVNNPRNTLIQEGMQFDADVLNQERQRVASEMRRRGYFYFDQELIQFQADSSRRNGMIDVEMKLQDYINSVEGNDNIFR